MITFLSKLLIKDYQNIYSPEVRRSYGVLCGSAGIFFNIILFIGKFIAGALSRSISITADAFNNLSDAGSSIITLIGFKMAGQKPDSEHPFGHGRFEYLSGFLVAIAILLMAVELLKTSIEKIKAPEPTEFNLLIAAILIISILLKLYMAFYNKKIGHKISSPAMSAAAADSISDCIATGVVLLSSVFASFTGILIDGWCGLAVGLFILYAGVNAVRETINPLLGQPPSKEFVEQIQSIVTCHQEVLGIHDLLVHDYGPGRVMVSLHAEVPASGDILKLHDTIDCIEHELRRQLNCEAVIHMDPIATDDEDTKEYKALVLEIVTELDASLSIHDFRIVKGHTHTNLIFDVVVPFKFFLSDSELKKRIDEEVKQKNPALFTVIEVDKDYT